MSTEQQQQTMTAVTKKHTRSRGRAKARRAQAQDPYTSVYGSIPWKMFRTRPWTYAGKLNGATVGKYVLVFGHVLTVRPLSKTKAIMVLLNLSRRVRCIVEASQEEGITTRMVRFAATMRCGTTIDVEGVVSLPGIHSYVYPTSQQVEIQVRKLHTMGTLKDGSEPGWESCRSSLEQEEETS